MSVEMKSRKKIVFLFLIISAAGGFLYFRYPAYFKDEKPVVSREGVQNVIVAIGSEPRTLDPRKATDANGMRIMDLLFQSLVRLGPRLEVLPSAAHSWSYKDNTYVFVIDKKIKFSNGRSLTKEDLLFSFEEYRFGKSPFSSSFDIIASVDVEEKDQNFILKITLKKKSAKFLSSDLPVFKNSSKGGSLISRCSFSKKTYRHGIF